jgi:hypothetical protein
MGAGNTRRALVNAAAGVLAFAGGDKINPQATAEEPPAKTASAPDAKLNAAIATLEADFGHRTPGSKNAKDAIAQVEDDAKRKALSKQLTETIPPLIDDLKDSDKRAGARKKLDQEIKSLINDLGDDDFRIREAAMAVMNDFSHHATGALAEAKEKNEDYEIKYRAKTLIDMNHRISQADAKKLMADLKAFGALKPPPSKALPLLMEAFWKSPIDADRSPDTGLDRDLKQQVIGMLADLKAVPQLVEILRDEGMGHVRDITLETIGNMGAEAKAAVPAVKALFLKEHNYPLGTVLAKIRVDEKNVPDLLKELKSADVWERWSAMLALSDIAPKVKLANKDTRRDLLLQFIEGVQKDSDFDVRREAAKGIENLSRNSVAKEERALLKEKAVPALIEGLKYFNDTVKEASASALKVIGAEAESALPILKEVKDSTNVPAVANACDQATTAINDAISKGKSR